MAFTVASDDFNRTNSSNLGSDWTEQVGDWEISSNQLNLLSSTPNNDLTWDTSLGNTGPDYEVEAVVNLPTTGGMGVFGRWTDTSNYYYIEVNTVSQLERLRKRVSGSNTTLGEYSGGYSVSTNYTIKLKMVGSYIYAYEGGNERISTTDTAITATGKPGIRADSGGKNVDNFKVYGLGVIHEESTGSTTAGSSGSELLISHTVSDGDNTILIVALSIRDRTNTINYVKWKGTSGTNLTKLRGDVHTSIDMTTEIWYLLNPSSGVGDVAIQSSANDQIRAFVVDLAGIDQTPTTVDNGGQGSSSSPSTSVTTSGEYFILSSLLHEYRDAGSLDSPSTNLSTSPIDEGQYWVGSGYRCETTSSTFAVAWTVAGSDDWIQTVGAFKIKDLSGGGGSSFIPKVIIY